MQKEICMTVKVPVEFKEKTLEKCKEKLSKELGVKVTTKQMIVWLVDNYLKED